jgi:phosphohistidine phosphatase SixA
MTWIIRHATPIALNPDNSSVCPGPSLIDEANEECRVLRNELSEIASISHVYCSPLLRCTLTAKLLFPNAIIIKDDRLSERNGVCDSTLLKALLNSLATQNDEELVIVSHAWLLNSVVITLQPDLTPKQKTEYCNYYPPASAIKLDDENIIKTIIASSKLYDWYIA